eukprot:1142673-Pelagomonas_calceolata.AAC.3
MAQKSRKPLLHSGEVVSKLSEYERTKEQLCSPSLATCIKERSPVLKGRAPQHKPRGRASTEV